MCARASCLSIGKKTSMKMACGGEVLCESALCFTVVALYFGNKVKFV